MASIWPQIDSVRVPTQSLKSARLASGFDQRTMAKLLGISRAAYSQIELGKQKMTFDLGYKIALLLNISCDDLFTLYYRNRWKEKN